MQWLQILQSISSSLAVIPVKFVKYACSTGRILRSYHAAVRETGTKVLVLSLVTGSCSHVTWDGDRNRMKN